MFHTGKAQTIFSPLWAHSMRMRLGDFFPSKTPTKKGEKNQVVKTRFFLFWCMLFHSVLIFMEPTSYQFKIHLLWCIWESILLPIMLLVWQGQFFIRTAIDSQWRVSHLTWIRWSDELARARASQFRVFGGIGWKSAFFNFLLFSRLRDQELYITGLFTIYISYLSLDGTK